MERNNWWVIWDIVDGCSFAVRSSLPLRENEDIELLDCNLGEDKECEDSVYIHEGDWEILAGGMDEATANTLINLDSCEMIKLALYTDFAAIE